MSQHPLKVDWTRFGGYSFQDMCNDLLVAKNIHIVPLQSGPYRDQGRDAFYFEGSIDDLTGKFIFQHKFHRPRLGNTNFNYLKRDLIGSTSRKGEIEKAEQLGADYLILMTNVPLSSNQIDTLVRLTEGKAIRLHVWDERKIISLLTNFPYVRYFYINGPEYPMFVPLEHFFEDLLKDTPQNFLTHSPILQGRDKELRECLGFIESSHRILRIYAPPGQGKSRLVIEFAKRAGRETSWIPFFIRSEGKVLEDHLDELNPRDKYLLFLEDAHLFHKQLKDFLTLTRGGKDIPTIKLVITARVSFSGIIENIITRFQAEDLPEPLMLPPLSREHILAILKEELPNISEIYLKNLLPLVKDSPLMAVASAQLVKRGGDLKELLKPGYLRRRLFEDPLGDLRNYCKEQSDDVEKYENILTLISALQPVSLADTRLLEKMSTFLSIESHELRRCIGILVQLGFLKKFGQKIRLFPDTLATIILENRLLTPQGESTGYGEEIVETFSSHSLEHLLDNMAEVGRHSFPDKDIDILSNILNNMKKQALQSSNTTRMQIVWMLKTIASRRGADVLEILETILNSANPYDDELAYNELVGDVCSTLGIVAQDPKYLEHVLYLLKKIALNGDIKTFFDDNEPDKVISSILSYGLNKSLKYQSEALEIVTKWKDENPASHELAVRCISPLFNASVGFVLTSGATITFGSLPIQDNESVRAFREKALSFLEDAIQSDILGVQLAAVDTAGKIGAYGVGPAPSENTDISIKALIEKEILRMIKAMEKVVGAKKPNLYVMGKIENQLWHWWAHKTDKVAGECIRVIKMIQQSPEFMLFKLLYIDHCLVNLDINEAEKLPSETERSRYFAERVTEELDEILRKIFTEIGNCDSFAYWEELLMRFDVEANSSPQTWKYASIMSKLAEFAPWLSYQLFMRKHGTPWEKYGNAFLAGIRKADRELWLRHLDTLLSAETTSKDKIIEAIEAINPRDALVAEEVQFLDNYSTHPSKKIRVAVANNLYSISKGDWALAERLSGNLIKHDCNEKILKNICSALLNNRPKKLGLEPSPIEKTILDLFQSIEELDEFWCLKFIASFAKYNPRILLEIAEKRGRENKEVYHLEEVFNEVLDPWRKRDDFLKLFDRVAKWIDQGPWLSILAERVLSIFSDNGIISHILSSIDATTPESIVKTARIVSYFEKNEIFFDTFAKLLSMAEVHGQEIFKEVHEIFSTALWLNCRGRTIGEPDPLDLQAIKECERIFNMESLSPCVKHAFKKCITSIQKRVSEDLERDEELLEY